MTPAPLARDCSSCDGTGRIAGRWCPVCAGRGWHPAVAQCIPGQRAGVWECRTRGPICAWPPLRRLAACGHVTRRVPYGPRGGDYPCTVTP